jgi:hypothetical protein
MREIKFRAWRGKEMIYDVIVWNNETILEVDEYEHNQREVKAIMQFTGLTDKNGKEIYEGDIVKSPKKEYEVVWNNECARWGLLDGINYPVAIHHEGTTLEVIGNVHENPELLNK